MAVDAAGVFVGGHDADGAVDLQDGHLDPAEISYAMFARGRLQRLPIHPLAAQMLFDHLAV
jgi:hypothetical protein